MDSSIDNKNRRQKFCRVRNRVERFSLGRLPLDLDIPTRNFTWSGRRIKYFKQSSKLTEALFNINERPKNMLVDRIRPVRKWRLKHPPRNYFCSFYPFELKVCWIKDLCIPNKRRFFCFSTWTVFGEKMTSQDWCRMLDIGHRNWCSAPPPVKER